MLFQLSVDLIDGVRDVVWVMHVKDVFRTLYRQPPTIFVYHPKRIGYRSKGKFEYSFRSTATTVVIQRPIEKGGNFLTDDCFNCLLTKLAGWSDGYRV